MILQDTLRYLDLQPKLTAQEKEELNKDEVTVPNLVGEGLEEAIGILGGMSLSYKATGGAQEENFLIRSQYPKAGAKIEKEGTVYLYNQ